MGQTHHKTIHHNHHYRHNYEHWYHHQVGDNCYLNSNAIFESKVELTTELLLMFGFIVYYSLTTESLTLDKLIRFVPRLPKVWVPKFNNNRSSVSNEILNPPRYLIFGILVVDYNWRYLVFGSNTQKTSIH